MLTINFISDLSSIYYTTSNYHLYQCFVHRVARPVIFKQYTNYPLHVIIMYIWVCIENGESECVPLNL